MLNLREVSRSNNGHFFGLMREKVVHTSSESSLLLAGKSQSGHGGNSCSKRQHGTALFLASINFGIAGRGTKIAKRVAQNRKHKIAKYCKIL